MFNGWQQQRSFKFCHQLTERFLASYSLEPSSYVRQLNLPQSHDRAGRQLKRKRSPSPTPTPIPSSSR